MRRYKQPFLILLAGSLMMSSAVGAAEGEGGGFEREIEYRESVMNLFSWNMKPMGAMMKGKIPYDQAVFADHAQDLAVAASLNLLPGFPEDSDEGETDALAEIWMDFEDFEKKFKDLRSAANALNKAVSGGDQSNIKSAFSDVGKACKACHKAYKN